MIFHAIIVHLKQGETLTCVCVCVDWSGFKGDLLSLLIIFIISFELKKIGDS